MQGKRRIRFRTVVSKVSSFADNPKSTSTKMSTFSTALDVTVQASILDLLKELQQETGMAMIFITHDLGVISKIADEVIVMYKGNIVEQGQTKLVLENPLHPYTKGLLSCRPSSNINLKKLPTVTDFMKINEDGTFSETGITITQLRNELLLTEEDRSRQKIKIESQENILSVKDLVVSFPTSKNIAPKKNFFFHQYKSQVFAKNRLGFCTDQILTHSIFKSHLKHIQTFGECLNKIINIVFCMTKTRHKSTLIQHTSLYHFLKH